MSLGVRFGLLLIAACVGGVIAGYEMCSNISCSRLLGIWSGRGALVGMCDGAAIYESDVARNDAEEAAKIETTAGQPQRGSSFDSRSRLGANTALEGLARNYPVSRAVIDREIALTRSQFRSPLSWANALRTSGLSPWSLRAITTANLRTRAWIEGKVASGLTTSAQECTAYYQSHQASFAEPLRLRARHIFFAAPPGSPPDLVEQKRGLAQSILERLGNGESFETLAMESEDESNKKTGGDLNFFAETRVPADFWAALRIRQPGDGTALFRTRLGFHVAQLTDLRPGREMSMEEARGSIVLALQNEKRSAAVAELRREALGQVQWLAPDRR
jgi:hypothetical protein